MPNVRIEDHPREQSSTLLAPIAKRLERSGFLWPPAKNGSVVLTAARSLVLLESDWRVPRHTWAASDAAG